MKPPFTFVITSFNTYNRCLDNGGDQFPYSPMVFYLFSPFISRDRSLRVTGNQFPVSVRLYDPLTYDTGVRRITDMGKISSPNFQGELRQICPTVYPVFRSTSGHLSLRPPCLSSIGLMNG